MAVDLTEDGKKGMWNVAKLEQLLAMFKGERFESYEDLVFREKVPQESDFVSPGPPLRMETKWICLGQERAIFHGTQYGELPTGIMWLDWVNGWHSADGQLRAEAENHHERNVAANDARKDYFDAHVWPKLRECWRPFTGVGWRNGGPSYDRAQWKAGLRVKSWKSVYDEMVKVRPATHEVPLLPFPLSFPDSIFSTHNAQIFYDVRIHCPDRLPNGYNDVNSGPWVVPGLTPALYGVNLPDSPTLLDFVQIDCTAFWEAVQGLRVKTIMPLLDEEGKDEAAIRASVRLFGPGTLTPRLGP